jgi:hypothetical protein
MEILKKADSYIIPIIIKACEVAIAEPAAQSWCPMMWHKPGKHIRAVPRQAGTTEDGSSPAWLVCSEGNKAQRR